MAWRKNDPSLGNDPSYLEPRISKNEKDIQDIQSNSHTHTNKSVLEKFDEDTEGNPTYNGTSIRKVSSVNGQTGEVELVIPSNTSELTNDSGFITVSSVTKTQVGLGSVQNYAIATQAEAEAGTSTSKYMTPQRTAQAIAKLASKPNASQITIDDTSNLFTATNVEDALSELFTNVSNGKVKIATAITDKGVQASGSDTFDLLANKIGQISGGKKYATGQFVIPSDYKLVITGINFKPSIVIARRDDFDESTGTSIYADFSSLGISTNVGFYIPASSAVERVGNSQYGRFEMELQSSQVGRTYTWIAIE